MIMFISCLFMSIPNLTELLYKKIRINFIGTILNIKKSIDFFVRK